MIKKGLISIILFVFILNCSTVYGKGLQFRDIEESWATEYKFEIYQLSHLGIIKGYEDNQFKPFKEITREEFIKALISLLNVNLKQNNNQTFKDVSLDRWSHQYIEHAVSKGIIVPTDYFNRYFQPNKKITRQEMAVILGRLLKNIRQIKKVNTINFNDKDKIDNWAISYVSIVTNLGLIKGDNSGNFNPQKTLTRLETAIVLNRLLKILNPLEVSAFYAIKSYGQADKIRNLDQVVFGWSSITEDNNGNVKFTFQDSSSVYRLPEGYEEVIYNKYNNKTEKLLMVFENNTKLLNKLLNDNYREVVEDISEVVKEYNFDGITIDFEGIRDREYNKENFINFLDMLDKELKDKKLSVAVPPRNVNNYYDGYDFKRIGLIADEVILMAYDYQDKDFLSATAPMDKIVEAIRDALIEIPKEKLVLGLQVVEGVQWRYRKENNEADKPLYYQPSIDKVYKSLKEKNGNVEFNYSFMMPVFVYEDEQEKNIIIYENESSVKSKILAAKYFGIKGIALWRLGIIQKDIWNVIKSNNIN
ncbi:S-layer homology domain-containing protein [Thermohalobacter berrensis]|uniref:Glycoside hydrolase n=1 Tax=Thermohalobacter berrensis TaxID=99594 RepID=A0A419T571_9FIRM|nr:S-layer homology domain-containing protein [Thermohalobacter berrensis]RKD32583.1 hypothetical protein BET03_10940 [Thermohalobacter berrensis]